MPLFSCVGAQSRPVAKSWAESKVLYINIYIYIFFFSCVGNLPRSGENAVGLITRVITSRSYILSRSATLEASRT